MIDAPKSHPLWFSLKAWRGRWLLVALGLVALLACSAAPAHAAEIAPGTDVTVAGEGTTEASPPATVEEPVAEATSEEIPVAVEPPAEAPEAPPVSSEPPPPAPEPPPVSEPPPPAPEPPPAAEPPPAPEVPPPAAESDVPVAEDPPPATDSGSKERSANELSVERSSETTGEAASGTSESNGPPTPGEGREAGTRLPSTASSPTVTSSFSESAPSQGSSAAHASAPPNASPQRACAVAGLLTAMRSNPFDVSPVSSAGAMLMATNQPPGTVTRGGVVNGSGDDNSAATTRPLSNPGPSPGGSSGGSAAGSSSGSATSTPATPVELLLQAAPAHGMCRSRLSQPSWRTSFFALMPERPD